MSEEAATKKRGNRKERIGRVMSNAMDKTIVVAVERRVRHPIFKKEIRRFSRLHAHDEDNEARVGDRVRVRETRPLSRRKCWRLCEILIRANPASEEAQT